MNADSRSRQSVDGSNADADADDADLFSELRRFEDLESSVAEAAQHKIVTEDVKKAEGDSL